MPKHEAAEHEFEAEPGLPEPLPRGERILWQGSPDWRVMAREALHTRMLSIYFGVLLAWRGATVLGNGGSLLDAGVAVLWLLPFAVLAIAVLTLMAWLIARTSVYTVTDKRVVMRIGVVLNITFNLPHAQIESAGLRSNPDGSGDLTLLLADTDRIAYVHLWPHARPWHVKRTQPMLRALPDVRGVAALLSAALADSAGVARSALPPQPQPQLAPAHAGQEPLAA
ncbi:MAG: PH domain-containing protein [Rhizobiales bacterium]|nr:PH domain-containing protein [Rhizobacter sp.]